MKHILTLAVLALACHALTPKQQAAFDLYACRVDAVEAWNACEPPVVVPATGVTSS